MLKKSFCFLLCLFATTLVKADKLSSVDRFSDDENEISIDSIVEHSSFELNIAQLLWFSQNNLSDPCSPAGGIISSITNVSFKENSLLQSYEILDLTYGFKDSLAGSLPFPDQNTRKAAQASLYEQLNLLYPFDYFIDVPLLRDQPLYFGVMLDSLMAQMVPYYSSDSLYDSFLKFDQVYWLADCEVLDTLILKENFKRKQIRALKEKVKKVLSKKQNRIAQHAPKQLPDKTDWLPFEEWKWNTYAKSLVIRQSEPIIPITDLTNKAICTYTFNSETFGLFNKSLELYNRVDHYTPSANLLDDINRIKNYDYVILPVTEWSDQKLEFINRLNNHTQLLVVDFSASNNIEVLPSDISVIMAWETNDITKTITAQAIFGAYEISGTLPFSDITFEPDTTMAVGRLKYTPASVAKMDQNALNGIDEIVEDAIQQQAFPGCQILVAHEGKIVFNRNFGYTTYDSLEPVTAASIYDLASLTKVLATTQAIMFLEERGLVDLNMPIGHYLPELIGSNKEFLIIREIMAHQAGLFPYLPFWAQMLANKKLKSSITQSPRLDYFQVGRGIYVNKTMTDSIMSWSIQSSLIEREYDSVAYEYKYSDIGFYMLKAMVEKIINQPIDEFLNQNLFKPMGIGITFNPLCVYPEDMIVPTESDLSFRKELLQGFVHDGNAAMFGGVSGHAGLFGNATDIAKLLQMHLQKGSYGGLKYFSSETIELFTSRQYIYNRRGLGWDKPGPEPDGPVSLLASDQTFGHTGFTGTAIWADPVEDLIFIFLSNRVYPTADNLKLVELNIRTRIQDMAYGAIIVDH